MSGRTLGRYRLSSPAEERAGVVLSAEDTLLARQVDLLLVPVAAAAEPARLERIAQEVARAAAFVHPNVATVYGLEEGDGRQLVTLEPVSGRSLTSLLAAGGVPVETALEVTRVLCDVLSSAQEAGVVHGGLYPGDVMLGEHGAVTVRGFGLHELRRAVEEELDEPSPAATYRAPETAPGLLPDHRADLFALGRILQEMVASGEQAVGEEARLPAAVASGLQRIVDQCLSADPLQRPRSAADLQAPLEELQRELLREPEPEETAPPRRLGRPARWGLLTAGVLLAVMVGWALWRGLGWTQRSAEPVTAGEEAAAAVDLIDLAVMPFAAAGEPAEMLLAAGFTREVARLLAGERIVPVVVGERAGSAAADDPVVQQVAAALGAEYLLEGSFLWQRDAETSRAEVTVRLSRANDGEMLWSETLEGSSGEIVVLQDRVAIGVARRLGVVSRLAGRPPLTLSLEAYAAYLEAVGRTGDGASTDELLAAAVGFEQAAGLDPGLLLAHTKQVRLQVRLAAVDAPAEPLAAARRALASARGIDGEDPEVRLAAGELELASGGDPEVALGELNTALEQLPGQPDLLRAVALIDRRQGRWDEAIAGLVAARRRDPLDLDLFEEAVQTLAWMRRFDEAAEQVERLAAALPDAAEPVLQRADLLLRGQGATGQARAALEEMPEAARAGRRWQEQMLRLELYDGEYGAALARLPGLRLERAEELIARAWIHRHMGRARQAAAGFLKARDLLDDRLEAAPGDPVQSSLLGQAYAGTGGPHLGIRMGQRALAQLPVTVDAVGGAEMVERMARIYVLAGDFEHALDELAFLLEIPSPVTVAVVRLDPAWEPLRAEARFKNLLERFGP